MIIVGVALPLGGGAISHLFFPDLIWNHEPFHAVVEAVGAFAALTLATLLYLQADHNDRGISYLFVISALIGMGILNGFHACVKPGVAFVWLHSTSSLVGGFLFALVWLPPNLVSPRTERLLPFGIGIAAVAFSVFSIVAPGSLPAMIHQGAFTPTAVGINLLGGVSFLVATLYFVTQYRQKSNTASILFATLCLLLGAGALLSKLSNLWDIDWWWWHVIRLVAYITVLGYIFILYQRTPKTIKENNRLLKLHITERKQAEQKLKEVNQRITLAADSARFGVWEVDLIKNKLIWDHWMFRIFGVDPKDFKGDIEDWAKGVHPDDLDRVTEEAEQTIHGEKDVDTEYRIVQPTGAVRHIKVFAAAMRNSDGNPIRIIGTTQDITERKRMEEALQESELKYRTLFETMVEGFAHHQIVLDDQGKPIDYIFLNVNRSFRKLTGLQSADILDKRVTEALPGIENDPADWIGTYSKVALGGEPITFEQYSETLNRWYSVFAYSPVRLQFVTLFHDITERKWAEKDLKRNYETQQVLNLLFQISLEDKPLPEILGPALDIILSVPFMHLTPKGGIFLVESNILRLKTHKDLAVSLLNMCDSVAFGWCLCGRAAASREIQFADCVDERHENKYEGYTPHGHYNIPILYGGEVLGVIVLYLEHGHVQSEYEMAFLHTAANTMASLIKHKRAEETLRQRNRELEFLNRVGQTLVSTLDLAQLLADVLEKIRQLLDVFGCSVWLLESAANELVCLQATAPHNKIVMGWKLAPDQGLVSWAVHHGQSILAADTRTDPRHYAEIDQRCGVEMRSIISVPLRVKQEIIGGVNVVDTTVNRFTPTDLSLVESLAATITIAIENARLFDREYQQRQAAEQALHETWFFYRISSILAQSSDMQTAVEQVLGEYLQALNLKQGGITLFDSKQQTGKLYALYQYGQPQPTGSSIKIVSRVYQELIESQQPIAIVDAWNDPLLADNQDLTTLLQIKSILFVPLLVRGQVVGALGADETKQPRRFSNREIELGQAVADQVAGAIDRIRLDEEQRRLTAVLEQATETFIITDLAGNIVYTNPYFEISSGYSVAEAMGQNPNMVQSGQHDIAFYQELWNTISTGDTWHGIFINKHKDGHLYHEETSVFPIKNAAGEIINYATVKRDITERVRTEEQLRQAQKMEAIGQLAGGVAHDFNNILTAIIGYASLPLDLNLLPPEHPVHSDLQGIIKSANRAADLTRQLLTFARRQIVEPQTLNLNDLIFNLDKMLRRLISENIELITLAGPNLGQIEADPGQIEQVLVNLVINARDAMPDGGKLTIETANVTLGKDYADQHTEVNQGEYVMLAVSDTGLGMTKEVRARIFEPFFTTKDVGQGTGLGLATCFGIVKQSGGHLWVYSEVGWGTTFKVYLPYVKEAISLVLGRNQSPGLPWGRETILLVEDEAAVRSLAARILREQGYTILEAANGEKALRLVEAKPELEIQLLLTDVVMPLLGGQGLAEQLSAARPHLKVLFMSGYTDNPIAHHGVLEASIAFLKKPFSPSALAHKVRKVLDG